MARPGRGFLGGVILVGGLAAAAALGLRQPAASTRTDPTLPPTLPPAASNDLFDPASTPNGSQSGSVTCIVVPPVVPPGAPLSLTIVDGPASGWAGTYRSLEIQNSGGGYSFLESEDAFDEYRPSDGVIQMYGGPGLRAPDTLNPDVVHYGIVVVMRDFRRGSTGHRMVASPCAGYDVTPAAPLQALECTIRNGVVPPGGDLVLDIVDHDPSYWISTHRTLEISNEGGGDGTIQSADAFGMDDNGAMEIIGGPGLVAPSQVDVERTDPYLVKVTMSDGSGRSEGCRVTYKVDTPGLG